jgi:polyisoprenoid-binding protein YceI
MGFAFTLAGYLALSALAMPPAQSAALPAGDPEPLLLSSQFVRIDPFHSVLSFTVRHFGFTNVRGHFNEWGGYILWDPEDIERSSFTVVVKTGTVDTGLERRDDDLRSDQFFNSEEHPVAIFRSIRIEKTDEGMVVYGMLTIGEVTKEVALPFEFLGTREFGPGFGRIFASGGVTISREEFGLTNAVDRIARSLSVVSDEVELEIEIQGAAIDPVALPFDSREKPSIGEELARLVAEDGAVKAVERYHILEQQDPEAYNFSSDEVLKLAHRLRAEGKAREAVELSKLAIEIEEQPRITSHASLALAYLALGDEEQAVGECRRMLEIDSYDPLALEMLRQLTED